jgi:AraC-like DNA-binding protein
VWTSTSVGATKRVLPDGCMDLIWSEGALLVAGPDSRAALLATRPGTTATGLRFAPGWAPWLLGLGADELLDQRPALDRLRPAAEVRRWTERVAEAAMPGRVLEDLADVLLAQASPPPAEVPAIVAALRGGAAVAEVADRVGLSDRQLHRRSLQAFGYGAKRLGRILRLQRALTLASAGVPAAAAAARTGYVDQPHLAREVRALTGVTLRALLR